MRPFQADVSVLVELVRFCAKRIKAQRRQLAELNRAYRLRCDEVELFRKENRRLQDALIGLPVLILEDGRARLAQ